MTAPLKITHPRDGDVLNRHDGVETGDSLRLAIRGTAPHNAQVVVDGNPAQRDGDAFSCEVSLSRKRSVVIAESGGERDSILLWWNEGSEKRYRFSCDDNILFLKDLAADPARYPSLFDHWYLKFWQDMHGEFGARIHLNIYYQTDGFDLTEMPDVWKEEWQANASWLHLSFHALQDRPGRPYRNARYPQVAHDYDLVCGHIRRFAGNEVISTTTTVHWAECPKDAVIALRDRGIENLIGLFEGHEGTYTTGYYFPPELCRYCDSRGAWYDRETELMFINCAAVVNAFEVDEIVPRLEARATSPHTGEMLELLIHEQYFRKELDFYQPTVQDKVRAALQWVTAQDYAPVFWSDGFLGIPEERSSA